MAHPGLHRVIGQDIFGTVSQDSLSVLSSHVDAFLLNLDGAPVAGTPEQDKAARETLCLIAGVSLLQAFIQSNWTGPALTSTPDIPDEVRQAVLKSFELDGETMYSKVRHPHLLQAANLFLVDKYSSYDTLRSLPWWSARAMFIHQRCLSGKSSTIKGPLVSRMEIVERRYIYNSDTGESNWTGPALTSTPDIPDEVRQAVLKSFELDGETMYSKVRHPHLLQAANLFLVDKYSSYDTLRSLPWWSARAMFIHQRCLSGKSSTIKGPLVSRMEIVERRYIYNSDTGTQRDRTLAIHARIELSLIFYYYRQLTRSR
eukprot:TRINITY_DN9883_c0_g1_i2.p1 TRINITY_DN9883_c0_g1~~TRINITY_DN9883_c0_g1_i2.p1  ORF type:complete len:369 (-),score=45.17 TRINITY_DN9883_c0_g1_i2:111-1055(-)